MIDPNDTRPIWKRRSPYLIILSIIFISLFISVVYQSENIKRTIRMRLFAVSAEHVIYKEEIKEMANQAVAEIATAKQDSIATIDNKTQEAVEAVPNATDKTVVPEKVLKALNKARRETK